MSEQGCSMISDEEAMDWPLTTTYHFCTECNTSTRSACDYCGYSLCEELDCIKSHAAKGCYNQHRHALQSQANGNQNPAPHAGSPDNSSSPSAEPAVDGQAVKG